MPGIVQKRTTELNKTNERTADDGINGILNSIYNKLSSAVSLSANSKLSIRMGFPRENNIYSFHQEQYNQM